MSDNVITVENLSKSYLVGHESVGQSYKRYTALRDVIGHEVRNFARNAVNLVRGRQVVPGDQVEEFWALKDVSFEVRRGEVLGIIGRNGAGKSTLLKILSRITEPTRGRVTLRGRVASLLEVGTGFHPELTGRENIYLNGAILGMTRAEIRRKFDDIVTFAEVEKFLDTPVKRYSSGMYVRLAFAVAAHLEPEILIVDEVLAVGDVEFQKKCLGAMGEFASNDRTVLFVSHNMGAISTLTNKCILLDRGGIVTLGNTANVIAAYFNLTSKARGSNNLELFRRWRINDPSARIVAIGLGNKNADPSALPQVPLGAKFTIEIGLDVYRTMDAADICVALKNLRGEPVTCTLYSDRGFGVCLKPGHHSVKLGADYLSLAPGQYFVDIVIDRVIHGDACDIISDYPLVSVVNQGQVTDWPDRPWGSLFCQDVTWDISEWSERNLTL
jgi:lipopolysaccharide transport system ATP-binding protein